MRRPVFALIAILGMWSAAATAAPIIGLGVLGDSGSDEYRANDNRGGAYSTTTLNWLELLSAYRGVNAGAWGSRSYPRRDGFNFNWALSGARVRDVIDGGQALGLAAQVAAGSVSHVLIYVGENDFADWNGTYAEIYDGTLSDAQVAAKVQSIVSDIATAIDMVRASGPVSVLVATIADRGATASFVVQYPIPGQRQRVTDAIDATNRGIVDMAAARGAVIVDMSALASSILPQVDAEGNLVVAGEKISLITNGDEPHHVLLGDAEHAGTVFEGVLANYILDALSVTGADVPRFTDLELIHNAGIWPVSTFIPSWMGIVQGSILSGALASLASNENSYLVLRSTSSGNPRVASLEVRFGAVPRSSSQLRVTVRCKASVTGAAVGVSFFNVSSGTWTDPRNAYYNIGTLETANTVSLVGVPADYINEQGIIRVQVVSGRPVNSNYTISVDEISLSSL